MQMIPLTAAARDGSTKANMLRQSGKVPCIVYGHHTETMSVECALKELHKAFVAAGESTLVELDVSGKKIPVLFKDLSFDPVSGKEIHVDFYAVNMKEELEAPVHVKLEGESIAVKELSGILVTPQSEVTVRCLPADLPHELVISIDTLANFGDVVTVADLKIPTGVTVLDAPETVLATVQQPREEEVIEPTPTEAEAAAAAATAEGAAPAEGAEGAPAAEGAAPAGDAGKEKGKK